jgi:hypothetical protein
MNPCGNLFQGAYRGSELYCVRAKGHDGDCATFGKCYAVAIRAIECLIGRKVSLQEQVLVSAKMVSYIDNGYRMA